MRSDCIFFWFGILSPDAMHTSGGVIIFVKQGLSFSELSTSSLSLLDTYSDYTGVDISLNNSSSLSFSNVYAPPIYSSPTDSRTDSFSPIILCSFKNLFILVDFNKSKVKGVRSAIRRRRASRESVNIKKRDR